MYIKADFLVHFVVNSFVKFYIKTLTHCDVIFEKKKKCGIQFNHFGINLIYFMRLQKALGQFFFFFLRY